ncbi:MAG: S-layer homology domain-containing protein, partial [Clostridia bacterium]|nr:S-layer homology domain-containing protein [Clostridia bacterium]
MKKVFFKAFTAALAVISTVAITANADFAKTKTYADGTFTDVPASEWYAQSVKDAYEFGLMNGNSATTFNPDGTLTVAEAVTVAARIGETVTGKAIPEVTGGEWYAKYVSYCISEGIFAADKFNSYDRNITRGEMAELFAAVSGELPQINTVSDLPDVPKDAEFADSVFKLYRGGILTGNDGFGTFAPSSELKRSEISAMAVRVADSSKRVAKTFDKSPVRAYYDAYTVIEAALGTGSTNGIANGWNYDYRFNLLNTSGKDYTYIADSSDEKFGSLKRDFDPEHAGLLVIELYTSMKSQNGGVYFAFQNESLENVVSLEEKNGKFALAGTETVLSDIDVPAFAAATTAIRIELDLDNNSARATVNNRVVGTVAIPDCEVSRFEMGCRKIGTGHITLDQVYMNKNYPVYDRFFATDANIGEKPVLWDVTGDFVYGKTDSTLGTDKYSIKAESKAGSVSTASQSFDAIAGKVLFEANLLLPEKTDGASVSLTSGGNEIIKIATKNGKFVIGNSVLHDYTPNVWQSLYVVADTKASTALIKINGKERATVPFSSAYFDGVKIGFAPTSDGVMWFDDINVSNIIDHPDYPSYPQVAESKDYNIGINSCYLWRDSQSREGWDSVSPFEEFDPYMGYYDEGLVETADWELKWMAEHGIDFIHLCWYAPSFQVKEPIKEMRVSHGALHDGYMNAKYSDLVNFCIMWECGFGGAENAEDFKSYIWPYWKEYYFSDDRYLRLDNKAVITIYSKSGFESMLGGTESAIEVVHFMESELKSMGYDGLILWFTTQDAKDI